MCDNVGVLTKFLDIHGLGDWLSLIDRLVCFYFMLYCNMVIVTIYFLIFNSTFWKHILLFNITIVVIGSTIIIKISRCF